MGSLISIEETPLGSSEYAGSDNEVRSEDDGVDPPPTLEESPPVGSEDDGVGFVQTIEEQPTAGSEDDCVGSLQTVIEINDSLSLDDEVLQVEAKGEGDGPPMPHTSNTSSTLMEAAALILATPTFMCEMCGQGDRSEAVFRKHMEETHKSKFKKTLKPRKIKKTLKAKKRTKIVLNEVDSVSETSEDETDSSEEDTEKESSDDDTESDSNENEDKETHETESEAVNKHQENLSKPKHIIPPPAMWSNLVPELPVTWDFSGGSLPSSFLEKALAGVARKAPAAPAPPTPRLPLPGRPRSMNTASGSLAGKGSLVR